MYFSTLLLVLKEFIMICFSIFLSSIRSCTSTDYSDVICLHAAAAEKNNVRFSAYRTSLKLRLMQKLLKR